MRTLTSGLIPVQFAGNGASLYLFLSSDFHEPAAVEVRVAALDASGSKRTVISREITVAPHETARTILDDVDGETIEVTVRTPNGRLRPSLSVIGTFAADGAQRTMAWLPPLRFSSLSTAARTIRPDGVTVGISQSRPFGRQGGRFEDRYESDRPLRIVGRRQLIPRSSENKSGPERRTGHGRRPRKLSPDGVRR